MNYIVVFRRRGILTSLFFAYRDESDIVFKDDTLIRNIDDVIKVMDEYFSPDDSLYVIRETFLDSNAFREDNEAITEHLRKFLH
jgi:hypothetical protein|nr:MAG TPA: hypothetical protein [Caudoviricetes sp.]